MTPDGSDLVALLQEARRRVPDDQRIWCSASDTFESRLQQRSGMLLGGAYSPHFLRDASEARWEIPWLVRLRHCRVAICDNNAARQPLATWLPLMEAIVAAGEGLLVVTENIDSELLSTFVVNAWKGTLPVCVVRPLRRRTGSSGARLSSPPPTPDQLIRVDEVWVRRTATVLFPKVGEPLASAPALEDIVVIETGGENHEDQYDRLRYLMRELQPPGT
jgi:hypothetical protein